MIFDWDDERTERKRIGKKEKEAIYAAQKKRCMYCGVRQELGRFDVDHKNPVAKGGNNSFANYQLLCPPCNKRKGKMTDGEFRRKYKLGGVRGAKPPTKRIPLSYFEEKTKKSAARRAKKRKKDDDDWWF